MPVAAFLFGIVLTLAVAILLHKAERKAQERDLYAEATEFFRHMDLLALNSVLKIQAYEENAPARSLMLEVLRHTIFQRASIFLLEKDLDDDGLPVLTRKRMVEVENATLQKTKSPRMRSPTLRRNIGSMVPDGEYSRIVIHHDSGSEILSVVLRSTKGRNEYLVFSTPLRALISEIRWKSDSAILISSDNADVKWLINTWREKEPQITNAPGEVAQFTQARPRLVASHVLANSEIKLSWYYGTVVGLSGLTLIALGSGILISFLAALLIFSLLAQNSRISELVISRTRELAVALHEAQEANLVKTRFLANISHEVRTPLNLILGMLDLSAERSTDAKLNDYIKSMRAAGDHLLGLITDLLTMSQVDPVDPQIKNVRFESLAFFEEIARIIGPSARKKGLQFEFEIEPSVPGQLRGDPARLRQVVMNLLRNSVKYTNAGFVSLRIRSAPSTKAEEFRLAIDVSDSGVGIPKRHRSDVFNRFFQLESSRRFAEGGVGLGLSIVKELVDKMNGKIRLESTEGRGSTFTVDLALAVTDRTSWTENFKADGRSKVLAVTRRASLIHLLDHLASAGHVEVKQESRNLSDGLAKSDLPNFDKIIADSGFERSTLVPSLLPTDLTSFVVLDSDDRLPGEMRTNGAVIIDDAPVLPSNLLRALNFKMVREQKPADEKIEFSALPLPQNSRPERLRLVIADDDEGNRYLMKSYLEGSGWDIEFASNGEEALNACIMRPADILIVDLRMPVMDGFQTADHLRAYESTNNRSATKIILVTADALPETKQEAKSHAIDMLLTKPLRKKHLFEAISNSRTAAS